MDTISYWSGENAKLPTQFYQNIDSESEGITLIYGFYEHKNNGNKERAVGIYWNENYPNARGKLAPCIIPKPEATILLQGLLDDLLGKKEFDKASKVLDALAFLSKDAK